jgi:HD-like signal output (HDOD) protein/ActR/RegA family two-component response regulator
MSEKTRVLFVDDEPLVLQGLQRMLRPMRSEWEMAFVENGPAALQRMAEVPFQVVVSDMRMPGMNGAQLLSIVQDRYPQTVRLILSGHADKDLIMKCVGAAHQFLSKPCEPETLRAAIARGSESDTLLRNPRMKELIGRMDCLPSVPAILNELTEALSREASTVEDIANVINKDLGMTAKLLKLVNSAFFGLQRQVSSTGDAVSYLGIATIKALVLAVSAFSPFEARKNSPVNATSLWGHSLEVGSAARQIAESAGLRGRETSEVFIAGVLHDVGKLALAANLPAEYEAVLNSSRTRAIPIYQAEEAAFGANHATLGGYLLNLWGLPDAVVHGICFHHQPRLVREDRRLTVMAVHAADALCKRPAEPQIDLLDHEFIGSMGFTEQVGQWKQFFS